MARRARFDVHVLLPDVPHASDACFRRISDLLEAKVGVEAAHLIEQPGGEPGQLCVHFDPNLVSLQDVRRFTEQSGAELQKKYGHFVADMSAMRPGKAKRLTAELSKANGVLEAVAAPHGAIRIEFDRELIDEAGLAAILDELGPARRADGAPTTPRTHEEEDHVHGGILGANTEFIFVGLSGGTLLTGWLLQSYLEAPAWLASAILIASYCFGGFFTLREAIANIRARRFEIDNLMLVAAAGAAVLGKWAEGALLLFLFSLSHALEHYAMGRAKRAIEALGELSPETALVRRDGEVVQIAIAELRIGDTALVKPNERVPADGFVVKGESSVNQAPITGESVPVDKQPVEDADRAARNLNKVGATSRVFAGTINGAGALEIRVTRTSGDSTLARVVKMVREAEMNRSPSQQFSDRVERVFVPAVLVGAGLFLFAWLLVDDPMHPSCMRLRRQRCPTL